MLVYKCAANQHHAAPVLPLPWCARVFLILVYGESYYLESNIRVIAHLYRMEHFESNIESQKYFTKFIAYKFQARKHVGHAPESCDITYQECSKLSKTYVHGSQDMLRSLLLLKRTPNQCASTNYSSLLVLEGLENNFVSVECLLNRIKCFFSFKDKGLMMLCCTEYNEVLSLLPDLYHGNHLLHRKFCFTVFL